METFPISHGTASRTGNFRTKREDRIGISSNFVANAYK